MKRTVTALYETRAQAEQVRTALTAANLGDDVDIHDESSKARDVDKDGRYHDFGAWLNHVMGGHEDKHVYDEGVRRGHFMLTAKVEEMSETRAAEILDAATPVDLESAQTRWRVDGWAPGDAPGDPASGAAAGKALDGGTPAPQPDARWVRVRVYRFDEDTIAH